MSLYYPEIEYRLTKYIDRQIISLLFDTFKSYPTQNETFTYSRPYWSYKPLRSKQICYEFEKFYFFRLYRESI
jgi:hypothetical protein